MTITHRTEWAYQIYVPSHLLDSDHCWHMRFDSMAFWWESRLSLGPVGDDGYCIMRLDHVSREGRFIDACCRPGCTKEEIR